MSTQSPLIINTNDSLCVFNNMNENNHIGFLGNSQVFYIFICCLGIAVNICIFWVSLERVKNNKKKKTSSINIFLLFLSFSEFIISIIWIINVLTFFNAQSIQNNCDRCKKLGLITVFIYIFDWEITALSFLQLKHILINPLYALSNKKFFKYIFIALIISLTAVSLSFYGDFIGISVSKIKYM